jgi:hypothetical protein
MPSDQETGEMPNHQELGERAAASYEGDFRRTGNPIYVWEAIRFCVGHALDAEFLTGPRVTTAEDYSARRQRAFQRVVLPPWCLEYLFQASFRISDLSFGHDEKKRPTYSDSPDYDAALLEWHCNPTLSADEAADRLAAALGFRRDGWNAFYHRGKDDYDARILEDFRDLLAEGSSKGEAYESLAYLYDFDEVRSVQRRVAAAKRRLGWIEEEGVSEPPPKV